MLGGLQELVVSWVHSGGWLGLVLAMNEALEPSALQRPMRRKLSIRICNERLIRRTASEVLRNSNRCH
ncbi:MAG: hypothetical protein EBX49_03070 [Synechococcaceae bacterium WB8_1B_136]|nr:hypothetical protein [Synechococcaceae bacterium WB8_1B_136]